MSLASSNDNNNNNNNNNKNIAIAGASDVAKYLIEEITTSNTINNPNPPKITVLTRSLSGRPWFTSNPSVSLQTTDYTTDSIRSILDKARATALLSFIHTNDSRLYVNSHKAMLAACRSSECCRRFVPSDYGGDIERFPGLPRFYGPTHRVFREEVLERDGDGDGDDEDGIGIGKGVEWTVVNLGWFMDYFVQGNAVDPNIVTETTYPYTKPTTTTTKTTAQEFDTSVIRSYMKPARGFWPLNLDNFTATLLGTGNEPIGWTSARDVARALVALLDVPNGHWEKHTYVSGEIGTWNQAIRVVEEFFGRQFRIVREISFEDISRDVQYYYCADDAGLDPFRRAQAYMDEWNVVGATAVPMDRVQEQREKFFPGVKFRGIRELLRDAFVENAGGMV